MIVLHAIVPCLETGKEVKSSKCIVDHVSSIGTNLTKCSSKFDTISMNRPTVEVAICERDIDIVTINTNNIKRMHSTNEVIG